MKLPILQVEGHLRATSKHPTTLWPGAALCVDGGKEEARKVCVFLVMDDVIGCDEDGGEEEIEEIRK